MIILIGSVSRLKRKPALKFEACLIFLEFEMIEIIELIRNFAAFMAEIPIDRAFLMIVLFALGLVGYALYVVRCSLSRDWERE